MDIFYLYLDKFEFEGKKHEKEHAAGLYLIKYAAKDFYKLQNTEIEITNNKPHFKYTDKLHFSISHSKNIAAVCFDDYPIGFDIEFIKPRNYIPIAGRLNFRLKENTLEEFYKCWTRYEAEYKLQKKAFCMHTEKFQNEYIMSAASGICCSMKFNIKEAEKTGKKTAF